MPQEEPTSGALELPWPASAVDLARVQEQLGRERPRPWRPEGAAEPVLAGCFVSFAMAASGAGSDGDPAWAAAALIRGRRLIASAVVKGRAGARYRPGLLALRAGRVLEAAVRALPVRPEALLVNAGGRDHPRRAGLALHLGAVLRLPTLGVTHRPLLAGGEWPGDERGSVSPLRVGEEVVGYWLRIRRSARPLAVHAGWRIDPETAVGLVLGAGGDARTPEPLRQARRLARSARGTA